MLQVFICLNLFACAQKTSTSVRIVWPPPPHEAKFEFSEIIRYQEDFNERGFLESFDKVKKKSLFDRPFGVAAYQEKIYVTDMGQAGYYVFDLRRRETEFVPIAGIKPCGIDVDSNGNIYVVDLVSNSVIKVTAQGVESLEISDGTRRPAYIKVDDRRNRFFVSFPAIHKIYVFGSGGDYLSSLGFPGDGPGALATPQGMALDRDGNLYVADMLNSRLQVFSPEGAFLKSIGLPRLDDLGLERPRGVVISEDQFVYVADYLKGKLIVYDTSGELRYSLGAIQRTNHPLGFATPSSLAIAKDKLVVTDTFNRRLSVWKLLPRGEN